MPRLERCGDAAALDGEVLVRHHLGSEHRGEDAVVSEHDGFGHFATEEHLGELDQRQAVLLRDIRRFLDGDVG